MIEPEHSVNFCLQEDLNYLPGSSIVNWNRVLASEYYNFGTKHGYRKITACIRSMLQLFYPRKLRASTSASGVAIFRSLRRNDYDLLFERICSAMPFEGKLISKHWSAVHLMIVFRTFIGEIGELKSLINERGSLGFYLFFYYVKYSVYLGEVDKIKFDALIVFSDMQSEDNLLVQYANSRALKTITLQHALYVDLGTTDCGNATNYLNVCSKWFLGWGEISSHLVQRYRSGSTECVSCGNPMVSLSGEERDRGGKGRGYVTAVLDYDDFQVYNLKIIEIALKYCESKNLLLNIRMHPRGDVKLYDFSAGRIRIGLDPIGSIFAIGHSSSLIYELMAAGLKVFRLGSRYNSDDISRFIDVSSCEGLERGVGDDEIPFINIGKRFIAYVGNDSLDHYRDAFRAILELG